MDKIFDSLLQLCLGIIGLLAIAYILLVMPSQFMGKNTKENSEVVTTEATIEDKWKTTRRVLLTHTHSYKVKISLEGSTYDLPVTSAEYNQLNVKDTVLVDMLIDSDTEEIVSIELHRNNAASKETNKKGEN